MRNASVIEIAVKQPKVFRVDGVEYRLEFPVAAVAALEEKLGRSMKSASDWLRMQVMELPAVLFAGLTRNHPNEAQQIATAICDNLGPEDIEIVIDGLCVAAHPKAMERLQQQIDAARERFNNGGSPLPNVQSADAH